MSRPLLEVCVDSLAGVRAASEAGADRIELCSALDLGGLTPSLGLVREARRATTLLLFVMLRPRPGDFCFDADEYATLRADLAALQLEGADGFVSGVLNEDLSIDAPRTRELVDEAGAIPLTFHRAFDLCPDAAQALESLKGCGVARILTSGGARSAMEGAARIRELVTLAGESLQIVAGGGVDAASLPELLRITGVGEVHTSASRAMPPRGIQTPEFFCLSPTQDGIQGGIRQTDPAKVAACRKVLGP